MWPYSTEENEWLRPLRQEPVSPNLRVPDPGLADRIAWHAKHAGKLRAEAIAAFVRNLSAFPRNGRPKH
jgi:hypothetical protein